MSGKGLDVSGLRRLLGNIRGVKRDTRRFIEDCVKELANRLLAKVIPRTPSDSGVLRASWQLGPVVWETNGSCSVELLNAVDYAPYVEYGHRTANHMGWVEGKFMLTISVEELQRELPPLLERRMKQYLDRIWR
ncbi:HK97 gp10 family phage protein [Paenibacillus pinihumi]|uniref:HK97 gp10 family phage protein n=1 Tax=Paenibacillus pinihumi TaxID=669462 RepID=UPI000425067E|nr:HK97 gp10 family phage protein [Paenibacillus pinihumi]